MANFDVVTWWDRRSYHWQPAPKPAAQVPPTNTPHNPYLNVPGARQLSESVPDFLARLPPATTDWCPGLDWIRISNPHLPPPSSDSDHTRLLEGGAERLALFASFEQMASVVGRSPTQVRADISRERGKAVKDLKALAAACSVVCGKWMLFPEPGDVNDVWARVATATADNTLGIAAKVEPRVASEKARLICVYTRDFRDKEDVGRVLDRMRELELVRPSGRQIYYKSGWSPFDFVWPFSLGNDAYPVLQMRGQSLGFMEGTSGKSRHQR